MDLMGWVFGNTFVRAGRFLGAISDLTLARAKIRFWDVSSLVGKAKEVIKWCWRCGEWPFCALCGLFGGRGIFGVLKIKN